MPARRRAGDHRSTGLRPRLSVLPPRRVVRIPIAGGDEWEQDCSRVGKDNLIQSVPLRGARILCRQSDPILRDSCDKATRVGGVDLNQPRLRAALAAALALAAAPGGFTATGFAAKVEAMTGQREEDYTIRQAAYDLRKLLRAKDLIVKPGASRRYHVPPEAARTMAALVVLRDQVIGPILAGVRSPRQGRKPAHWTRIDRDYETLRIHMQTLFHDLAITTPAVAA